VLFQFGTQLLKNKNKTFKNWYVTTYTLQDQKFVDIIYYKDFFLDTPSQFITKLLEQYEIIPIKLRI
jgi:hypothetical protein